MAGEERYQSRAHPTDPTSNVASVPADPRRVYVGFVAGGTASSLTFSTVMGDGSPVSFILTQNAFTELWYERHGPMPSQAWTLTATLGATGYILELIDLKLQPE